MGFLASRIVFASLSKWVGWGGLVGPKASSLHKEIVQAENKMLSATNNTQDFLRGSLEFNSNL